MVGKCCHCRINRTNKVSVIKCTTVFSHSTFAKMRKCTSLHDLYLQRYECMNTHIKNLTKVSEAYNVVIMINVCLVANNYPKCMIYLQGLIIWPCRIAKIWTWMSILTKDNQVLNHKCMKWMPRLLQSLNLSSMVLVTVTATSLQHSDRKSKNLFRNE